MHVLKFLVLVDDLNAMIILLLGRRLANAGKVAVDSHDGWRSGMPHSGLGPVLFTIPEWRGHGVFVRRGCLTSVGGTMVRVPVKDWGVW